MSYFRFEKLEVWKLSIDWADRMFELADGLPQKHQFSLGEQLRRAALSVPTNIAEGAGRGKGKESAYFYRISRGSVYEVVSLLVMLGKRGHLTREQYKSFYDEANRISGMLTNLMGSSVPV